MTIALITGSLGLIGSEAVRFFAKQGFDIVGIDNNMRAYFFGAEASTAWNLKTLQNEIKNYVHHELDIRDYGGLEKLFKKIGTEISVVIHAAAQPSHDWAAKEPLTDFSVNAVGTLHLLELTRLYAKNAVFIFTSTNKVYGDTPNSLPFIETESRFEIDSSHSYYEFGINEIMSIDHSTHSLFGVAKTSADLMVQEYGRYFGLKTAVFRGGCLTGPNHSGAPLHGFLAYLMKCTLQGLPYQILGYKGKQVRDNIHSYDLVNMFWHFYQKPRCGEVYNAGGGRYSNCSMLEAVALCEKISGKKLNHTYADQNRMGDHIWWISDTRKFSQHYPAWNYTRNLESILQEIHEGLQNRQL